MKTSMFIGSLYEALPGVACLLLAITAFTTPAQAQGSKNVVLVHGAFADGSGWKAIYQILVAKGYRVTIVQNPATSLEDDVNATTAALDQQDGPAILVGHSWGGVVITEAGNHPKVAALVYVAAFQPDQGESALQLFQSAPPAPENGVLPPDEKGMVYYDQAKFHAGFCADLGKEEAQFMAASQVPLFAKGFTTPVNDPAWKNKPVYGVIATQDKSINPDILYRTYKRSNTIVTEVAGSHAVYISQPKRVAEVIIQAAKQPVK